MSSIYALEASCVLVVYVSTNYEYHQFNGIIYSTEERRYSAPEVPWFFPDFLCNRLTEGSCVALNVDRD